MTFSRDHVRRLVAAAIASGEAPSEDMPDFDDPDLVFGMPDETITTRVDVTPWLDRKRAAMEAHASQIHDMAMFLAMPPRPCHGAGHRVTTSATTPRTVIATPAYSCPDRLGGHDGSVSQVIKINAITVPEGSGDELARRFAARAGAVDNQDGFEGFELLKPTDERTTWLVVTRWRDEEAFQAWVNSPAFGHGYCAGADRPAPHGGPVSVSSELWSYEVSTGSPGAS